MISLHWKQNYNFPSQDARRNAYCAEMASRWFCCKMHIKGSSPSINFYHTEFSNSSGKKIDSIYSMLRLMVPFAPLRTPNFKMVIEWQTGYKHGV